MKKSKKQTNEVGGNGCPFDEPNTFNPDQLSNQQKAEAAINALVNGEYDNEYLQPVGHLFTDRIMNINKINSFYNNTL